MLREARGGAQGAGRAVAADDDRRVRPLHRLGLAARVRELHVLAVEVAVLLREQQHDHLARLVEAVEALLQRRQAMP